MSAISILIGALVSFLAGFVLGLIYNKTETNELRQRNQRLRLALSLMKKKRNKS